MLIVKLYAAVFSIKSVSRLPNAPFPLRLLAKRAMSSLELAEEQSPIGTKCFYSVHECREQLVKRETLKSSNSNSSAQTKGPLDYRDVGLIWTRLQTMQKSTETNG
jgi:hypothetical protein